MIQPAWFTARTFGNNQWNSRPTHRCCSASRPEKDFLVTERIWFPCRNLGKQQKVLSISNLRPPIVPCSIRIMVERSYTLTAFSGCPKQRKVHSCPRWSRISHYFGDPFQEKQTQRALFKKKKSRKTPHPGNNCACDVNKTLCGFTFRVMEGKILEMLKLHSKWLHALTGSLFLAFVAHLKVCYGISVL